MNKINYTGRPVTGFSFPVSTELNQLIGTVTATVRQYSIYHSVIYSAINYR